MGRFEQMLQEATARRVEHQARIPAITARMDENSLACSGCGEGWESLLLKFDEEMSKLIPDYRISQYKEKFGHLVIYLTNYNLPPDIYHAVNDLCEKYKVASATICEVCGKPGRIDPKSILINTLCNEHWAGTSNREQRQDAIELLEALAENTRANCSNDVANRQRAEYRDEKQ